MVKVGIIIGSTRPGRNGEAVAQWVYEHARKRGNAEYEIIDLKEHNLPVYDEPVPPSLGQYAHEHTKRWSETIARLDAFIFVTPEYNRSMSGALKNAIDFLYGEWNNKAAGFVSYGATGGTRAVEHLRGIMGEVQVADVRAQVALSLYTDWENFTKFRPGPQHEPSLHAMLDQVVAWGGALKRLREEQALAAQAA